MATTTGASAAFGDLLRRFRLAAELTQQELAERAGLSVRGISDLERGAPHVPRRATLQLLIGALRLSDEERDVLLAAARRLAAPSASSIPQPADLPPQPTPFIGREHDIAAVCALLKEPAVRLLTLTGPGGIGKTRLAVHVARRLVEGSEAEVRVVELAAVSEPELVLSGIAEALGVQETRGQTLRQTLQRALQDRQLLVVLDNFEHLLAAGPLVAELLDGCPRLRALVTSRSVLRLALEHVFEVPPLAVPDLHLLPDLEAISHYDAVRLFCERARSARADFALTAANARAVVEIGQRLEGLPLAIELAAARIRLFAPAALLARLTNRLSLLTTGARDVTARHRTLRGAIDWSYELLDGGEQRLFRRLAIFAGGCSFAAVEAVCASDDLGVVNVVDGLAALVDQSLVRQPESAESDPRFGMLETIREYAWERLVGSGEVDELRRRHAAYYLEFAEAAAPQLRGQQQAEWLVQLEREHDNLRAALRWSVECGAAEQGLRLGGALWQFWEMYGHVTEGRERLTEVLARARAGTAVWRQSAALATALKAAGNLAWRQGDYAAARSLHEESLAMHRELGDRRAIAISLNNLGITAQSQGDYPRARALHEESLAIRLELGEQWPIAYSLNNLAAVVMYQGDYPRARSLFEESLAIMRDLGDRNGFAMSLHNLGEVAHHQGDSAAARSLFENSLAIRRDVGDRPGIASSLHHLGDLAREQGHYAEARSLYQESLTLSREIGSSWSVARSLEGFAAVAADEGLARRALRLAGAAARLRASIGAPLSPVEEEQLQRTLGPAWQAVGSEAGLVVWAEGRTLSVDQAIADGLATQELTSQQPDRHG